MDWGLSKLTDNTLTEAGMGHLWKQINKLHPGTFDGWFGMEVENWIEFGVVQDDLPEEAFQKIHKGIDKKLTDKAYGWYQCTCGAVDCGHIWDELTQIPEGVGQGWYPTKDFSTVCRSCDTEFINVARSEDDMELCNLCNTINKKAGIVV